MVDALLRELARYGAMRQRSRELHEEHRQAVLSGSGRQHHDEAADALVVEALQEAQRALDEGWQHSRLGVYCRVCAVIGKTKAALKALGK